jgi:hypothetical protein
MHRFWIGLGTLAALMFQAGVAHSGKPLLELKVGDDAYVGRSVARNDAVCWLQSPDGRLTQLPLSRVTGYRKVSPQFRGLSLMEARDEMSRDWKQGFEVAAAGSYVVAAPPGKARAYAALLDEVHRAFSTFFSRRNFGLQQPEFPLMAIVFPNEDAFAAYCESDGGSFAPGLRGYYNPETNRIALFEDGEPLTLAPQSPRNDRVLVAVDAFAGHTEPWTAFHDFAPAASSGTIEANFRDTFVHEATHQLAFNMGLHARIGDNPRWVVEGLAMIFERNSGGGDRHGTERQRVNEERYQWFMQLARPQLVPIKQFLAADRPFGVTPLDAYSEAWALSFYLSERRPGDFAKYLQTIQQHDPLTDYTADQRVADFQSAFGKDIDWLQVEWLRFMDEL